MLGQCRRCQGTSQHRAPCTGPGDSMCLGLALGTVWSTVGVNLDVYIICLPAVYTGFLKMQRSSRDILDIKWCIFKFQYIICMVALTRILVT